MTRQIALEGFEMALGDPNLAGVPGGTPLTYLAGARAEAAAGRAGGRR